MSLFLGCPGMRLRAAAVSCFVGSRSMRSDSSGCAVPAQPLCWIYVWWVWLPSGVDLGFPLVCIPWSLESPLGCQVVFGCLGLGCPLFALVLVVFCVVGGGRWVSSFEVSRVMGIPYCVSVRPAAKVGWASVSSSRNGCPAGLQFSVLVGQLALV